MEQYRVEVGQLHDAKASNIVGAIANEAGLESQFIGTIRIFDNHSTVELPEGMPKAIFKDLKKVWVCGQKLQITKLRHEKKGNSFQSDDSHTDKRSEKRSKNHGSSDSKHAGSGKRFSAKKSTGKRADKTKKRKSAKSKTSASSSKNSARPQAPKSQNKRSKKESS